MEACERFRRTRRRLRATAAAGEDDSSKRLLVAEMLSRDRDWQHSSEVTKHAKHTESVRPWLCIPRLALRCFSTQPVEYERLLLARYKGMRRTTGSVGFVHAWLVNMTQEMA